MTIVLFLWDEKYRLTDGNYLDIFTKLFLMKQYILIDIWCFC